MKNGRVPDPLDWLGIVPAKRFGGINRPVAARVKLNTPTVQISSCRICDFDQLPSFGTVWGYLQLNLSFSWLR